MIDRYGLSDLLTFKQEVLRTTKQFEKIYSTQAAGISFETPEELWNHLGLKELTQKSFQEEMSSKLSKKSSSGSLLIREMLFAVNKVNYNQSNDINALAGMGESFSFLLFSWTFLNLSAIVSMCPLVTGEVFSLKTGWTSIHQVSL